MEKCGLVSHVGETPGVHCVSSRVVREKVKSISKCCPLLLWHLPIIPDDIDDIMQTHWLLSGPLILLLGSMFPLSLPPFLCVFIHVHMQMCACVCMYMYIWLHMCKCAHAHGRWRTDSGVVSQESFIPLTSLELTEHGRLASLHPTCWNHKHESPHLVPPPPPRLEWGSVRDWTWDPTFMS